MKRILKQQFHSVKVSILAISFAIILSICSACLSTFDRSDSSSSLKPTVISTTKETDFVIGDLSDSVLLANFVKACDEIGLDPDNIESMTKIDNWISGERYQFLYEGNQLTLYAFEDKTISAIKIGFTNVYQQGFSALSVDNYILDAGTITTIQTAAINIVTEYLSYPESSDFPLLDGYSYGRVKDVYIVSGYVEAANALGVKSKTDYYVELRDKGGTYATEYLILDNVELIGSGSVIEPEVQTELSVQNGSNGESSNTSFTIVGGTAGEYGVAYSEDGFDYIDYYIPAGKYSMKAASSNTNIFLCSTDEEQNSEGYPEPVDMQTFTFTTGKEVLEINITDDYYLIIPSFAKVTFTLIE